MTEKPDAHRDSLEPLDPNPTEVRIFVEVLHALKFSLNDYLTENPDLKIFGSDLNDLARHYLQHGYREGRELRFDAPLSQPHFVREMIQSAGLTWEFKKILKSVDRARSEYYGPFAQATRLLNLVSDMSIVVSIDHFEGPKIGDTLTAIPWITSLSRAFGKVVHVGGLFHAALRPLVSSLPLRFDDPSPPGPALKFSANVQNAFNLAGPHGLHIAQSYFRLAKMNIPSLPIEIDLKSIDCGLPAGFCLHPFTASDDGGHNKAWYPERWVVVIKHILTRYKDVPIYILGSKDDDISPYQIDDRVMPIVDRPLGFVLDLLRISKFFISLDSGLSHLAHFGGVSKHLLIYPEVVGASVAINPRGHVIRGSPERIDTWQVIDALDSVIL